MKTDKLLGAEYERLSKEIGWRKHKVSMLNKEILVIEEQMDQVLATTPWMKKLEDHLEVPDLNSESDK